MKKKLFVKVFTVLFLTTLISCSDDDSKSNTNTNPNDKIIGTWVYNGYYNEQGTFVAETPSECLSYSITFNSDGKGYEFEKDCDNGDTTNNMTWKNKGNNLFEMVFSDDFTEIINVTFTNDNQADITWDNGTIKERFIKQ